MAPHLSFLGTCVYGDTVLFCTDMTYAPATQPTFYDHTMGLLDTKDIGGEPVQKRIYRYTPNSYKVAISGMFSKPDNGVGTADAIISAARKGTANNIGLTFWSGGEQVTIYDTYISNLTINLNAGDVVTFSLEALGATKEVGTGSGTKATPSKLLTWDSVTISSGVFDGDNYDIASLSLTIQNNLVNIPVTATSANDVGGPNGALDIREIRIGMQQITGSLSLYDFNENVDTEDDIAISLGGGANWTFHVAYAMPGAKGSGASLFMSQVNFYGTAQDALK